LVVLGLLAAVVLLYVPTLGLGFFNLDDQDYILNNPYLSPLNIANLRHILSTPYFANYSPGHLLSYALDIGLAGGQSPRAMHASNVAWYGFVVCMVYVLGLTLARNRAGVGQTFLSAGAGDFPVARDARLESLAHWQAGKPALPRIFAAASAALLFAAHPAHVEVVAWLSSRKDLVATGFALVCLTCYLRYRYCAAATLSGRIRDKGSPSQERATPERPLPHGGGEGARRAGEGVQRSNARMSSSELSHPGPPSTRWGEGGNGKAWYAASLVSFLLASSGKQSVILLPLVMLAWDAVVEGRRHWRMLADKIPFGLVTVFFGWMTWNAQPSTGQAPNAYVLAVTQLTNLWLLTGLGTYVLYRPSPDPATASALVKALAIGGAALIWAVLAWWVWRSRVGQTFLSAGSGDFPVAPEATLESLGHRQTGKSALRTPGEARLESLGHRQTGKSALRTPGEARLGSLGHRQTGKSALRTPVAAFLCCWVLINMLPPMALSFMSPITDRYLFLPSVGVCLLLAFASSRFKVQGSKFKVPSAPATLAWLALIALALVWAWQTHSVVAEWHDPRSVWYFAAAKSKSVEGYQYSGEVFHEAADRVQEFIRSGKAGLLTNDLPLAEVVLRQSGVGQTFLSAGGETFQSPLPSQPAGRTSNEPGTAAAGEPPITPDTRLESLVHRQAGKPALPRSVEALRAEWTGASRTRTNSAAYRDLLWSLAWERYEQAVAHRGRLNTPNLFMRRGMILVSQGKPEAAIKEFEVGLELAQKHTYERVQRENVTHLQRALGVAYWTQGRYSEARDWLLKAQATQRQSGQVWLPTLDQEVQRITQLAPPKP
jgi:hypothetical protein